MSDIKIREFKWSKDFKRISKIVQEVWFFDAPTKTIGYLNAVNFMLHYLNQATHIVVTVDDEDNAIGILGLTTKIEKPVFRQNRFICCRARAMEFLSKLALYFWPKALVSRLFNGIFFDNYQRLRKMVPNPQDPEFLVMIVDPKIKGKGLGRALVQAGEDILASKGFEQYYLLTDSSCDVGFYDRLEMTKVLDVSLCFDIKHEPEYDHYLVGFLRGLIYTRKIQSTK